MNALIYTQSGGGKTVNSTLVAAPTRKKNLLICTDNSHIVLHNFERPNLDIKPVTTVKEFYEAYEQGYQSKKYDNIVVDNLSDLFDMWILELDESEKFKDMRQAYQLVYQSLKRLSRESTRLDCNTVFTAWANQSTVTMGDGTQGIRLEPKIPAKVLDNVAGLCNVVAYINTTQKDGKTIWYYVMKGSPTLMAKDQIACREICMPQDLFIPKKKAEANK